MVDEQGNIYDDQGFAVDPNAIGSDNATKGLFTTVESIVSANANAGFSIVKWTGTGAINTVGHGLSAAPEMILIKDLDSNLLYAATEWSIGNGNKLVLNSTAAA